MAIYLDCNATSPLEPAVQAEVLKYLAEEFGNAGSRTHDYGARALQAVQRARDQVADVVKAKRDEVVFTSGATESNNLALLGLTQYGEETGRKHVISTSIEHKAILEPLEVLARKGFEVTLIPPNQGGWVESSAILESLREDTLLISVMHANNETGVIQPVDEIAEALSGHSAYLHVDAAQGFGKDIKTLQNSRIDLISISGHKIYGPKGIGALVVRRRGYSRPPLTPLFFGGGQERGLRPGTLPVPLIAGLGLAAELAAIHARDRAERCGAFRKKVMEVFYPLQPVINGDQTRTLSHVLNFAIPGIDSEALIVALKSVIAISNGSACTSHSYQPSHVLRAMMLPEDIVQGAVRLSWCHMTEEPEWEEVLEAIERIR